MPSASVSNNLKLYKPKLGKEPTELKADFTDDNNLFKEMKANLTALKKAREAVKKTRQAYATQFFQFFEKTNTEAHSSTKRLLDCWRADLNESGSYIGDVAGKMPPLIDVLQNMPSMHQANFLKKFNDYSYKKKAYESAYGKYMDATDAAKGGLERKLAEIKS